MNSCERNPEVAVTCQKLHISKDKIHDSMIINGDRYRRRLQNVIKFFFRVNGGYH